MIAPVRWLSSTTKVVYDIATDEFVVTQFPLVVEDGPIRTIRIPSSTLDAMYNEAWETGANPPQEG